MIPLTKPYLSQKEIQYATKAIKSGKLGADGKYSIKLIDKLKSYLRVKFVFLVPSASSGLELAIRALELPKDSEIIVPSFTMTSTANAILACGLIPKFVDIEENDLAIDPSCLEKAISKKTKAIITVHYGGRIGQIDKLTKIAKKYKLIMIEDAACVLGAQYMGKKAGTIGDIGVFSFHETKNIICGEGGALVTNDENVAQKIDLIRNHGTDRTKVLKGVASSYNWQTWGGSFLLSDVLAAIALAQFEKMEVINRKRKEIAEKYIKELSQFVVPKKTKATNWHTFYLLVSPNKRDEMIRYMSKKGVRTAFHYLPLHSSPMGKKMGYKISDCPVTEKIASSIIRLPIYPGLTIKEQKHIINSLVSGLRMKRF